MNLIKTYKTPTNTYTLSTIQDNEVEPHAKSYLDYVALANNSVFHSTEITDLIKRMGNSVQRKEALSIYKDGIEAGYLYIYKASNTKNGILVLHTYDIDLDPIPKLLLIHEVYSTYKCVVYLPKDIYTMQNISLLSPLSHKVFRYGRVSTIKLQSAIYDSGLLDYLGIKEV